MMRWFIVGFTVLLSACAASPQDNREQAYGQYWNCVSNAVRPWVYRDEIPPRQAAMRAQARCNGPYGYYRRAEISYVRAAVEPVDYEMADRLGDASALQRRQQSTQALTDYVARMRANR